MYIYVERSCRMKSFFNTYKSTIISTIIIVAIIVFGIGLVYGLINGSILSFFKNLVDVTAPILIGFIIAYLSNPIVMFFEKHLFKKIKKFNVKRLLSILITFVLIILFVSFLIKMLIPNLISTLESFWTTYIVHYKSSVFTLATKINTIMDGFAFLDEVPRISPQKMIEWVDKHFPWIEELSKGNFSSALPNESSTSSTGQLSQGISLPQLFGIDSFATLVQYLVSVGISLFNIAKNILLGLFIAIYILMAKERCKATIRRFLTGVFSPRKVRSIIRFTKLLDRSFGGFIEGQLLDAIVVGIISYFVFTIFGIPTPHLLATIIAVTNVIPIFGPFIGGIPAAFLVLLAAPEKTLLFIILIFVIQQIDGNVICPHILGDKINISSLATIIAIVTMGGLFGILGMIIGVPIFAVAIQLLQNWTINSLRNKGLDTSLEYYYVGHVEELSGNTDKSNNAINTLFNKIATFLKNIIVEIKSIFSNQNKEK